MTFDSATTFVFGFLLGCFFSLVLSTFLARKVGQYVYKALSDYRKDVKKDNAEEDEKERDNDPANWWMRGEERY
jgi:hypothetical protein